MEHFFMEEEVIGAEDFCFHCSDGCKGACRVECNGKCSNDCYASCVWRFN